MRKFIVLVLLFLASVTAKADDLTDYQKRKVRQTVSEYCNLISQFARTTSNADGKMTQIMRLFSNDNVTTYNDLNNRQVMLFDYLSTISADYNHSLTFSFKENVSYADVSGLMQPNLAKSTELIYGQIELTKTIRGSGVNKTVKNVFVVNLQDFKIWGISSTSNISPYDLWLMGIQAYNKKDYDKALTNFEKCAKSSKLGKYVVLSQYSAGVMYINKEGCKNVKRKERDKRGINWLRKASKYYPKARQDLDRLGDY